MMIRVLSVLLSLACAATLFAASPSAPTDLTATVVSASKVDLSWSGVGGTYRIERSKPAEPWSQIATTTVTTYRVEKLKGNTQYKFRVRVTTAEGTSGYSSTATATTFPDTTAPTAPTGLQVTTESCSSVNLFWVKSTDEDSGVASYKLYRNAVLVKTVSFQHTGTTDTGLSASTSYCYTIKAVDGAGNVSVDSSQVCKTTPACTETTPPSVPTGLTVTPLAPPECGQINVTWNQSTDNPGGSGIGSGLGHYYVYRNGSFLTSVFTGSNPTTTFFDRDLPPSTTYSYRVSAVDDAGNESAQCAAVSGATPACADVTAPTVPTGLIINQILCTRAGLIWSDSTDSGGSGLRGYRIYRDDVLVGFRTSVSFTESALVGNTTYEWKVSAIDNAGNESAQSAVVSGTTLSCAYSKRFGGTGSESGRAIKCAADNGVVLAGYFGLGNSINFGGSDLISAGGSDIFLARFDSSGDHVWSKRFGGTGTEFVTGMALDASGNIILVGYFDGTGNFGASDIVSTGLADIFVAKYSSTGTHLWSRHYGNTAGDVANSVAVDSSGNILVTGEFGISCNFGGGTISAAFSGMDSYVLKLSSAGAYVWARNFTSTADDQGMAIGTDSAGNVFVTGYYAGTLNCGGGPFAVHGGSEIYLAKLSGSSGAHIWSRSFGGPSADKPYVIAVDSTGNPIICGLYQGSCDFGNGSPLTALGGSDIFFAKYANASGAWIWSKSIGSAGSEFPNGIAIDGSGNVLLVGNFANSINLGGGVITTTGNQDAFLGKYDSSGTYLSGRKIGGTSFDDAVAVTSDTAGNILVTGYFYGTCNFGSGALTSAGSSDVFLLRIDP